MPAYPLEVYSQNSDVRKPEKMEWKEIKATFLYWIARKRELERQGYQIVPFYEPSHEHEY